MNVVARKQAVRRDGNRVRSTVATEHTDKSLFDDLDSLGKAESVHQAHVRASGSQVRLRHTRRTELPSVPSWGCRTAG